MHDFTPLKSLHFYRRGGKQLSREGSWFLRTRKNAVGVGSTCEKEPRLANYPVACSCLESEIQLKKYCTVLSFLAGSILVNMHEHPDE